MSASRSSWWPSLAAILAYAVAILSVTTALVTGLLLDQFLQTTPYVSLFLCSIMFAAWFGGLGPSLLATVIAVLLFTYYFVDPGGSFEVAAKDVPARRPVRHHRAFRGIAQRRAKTQCRFPAVRAR